MSTPATDDLLHGYSVPGEGYDEAIGPSGQTRPSWQVLSRAISRLSPADLLARQRQADRLVEAEGASYLFHDDGGDVSRPWRLDPLPLVLGSDEWAALERGVAQRVQILDRVVADCYGTRRLIRDRVVPWAAVYGSPGYLPASRGRAPTSTRWITVYAVDLVRLGDGTWRVLRDLTDAPSGAGYALVNRNVSGQLLADIVRDVAPVSLGSFFTDMRAALDTAAPPDRTSPRTVVLSPGLGHASYFEHSYLAAHLGYHLAEPGDLVVRNEHVWLRSLGGLEQVDVLMRRVEGHHVDPLESPDGDSGVPGLARVARTGGVGAANSIGSGVVSSLAMLPFVDDAARMLGQELEIPALTTRWCGDPAAREEVLADLTRFVLHDIEGAGSAGSREHSTVFGSQLDDLELRTWMSLIEAQPHRVAAQEKVTFATSPAMHTTPTRDGCLIGPATTVLRVLAVVGRHGVSVLPGGLARVMQPATPIVTQTSGLVKDVWVIDNALERPLRASRRPARSMPQVDLRESLPTRAAEALYWAGRNADRSETMVRATVSALTALQSDPSLLTMLDGAWRRPVVAALFALTGDSAVPSGANAGVRPDDEFHRAVSAVLTGPNGLPFTLGNLSRAAASGRQFVSSTTWRVLGELASERAQLTDDIASAYDPGVRRQLDTVLMHLSSLAGLFTDSTVRGPAWRFLEIGRRIERALCLLAMIEAVVAPADPAARLSLFDYLLASNESLVAYRRRYRSDVVLDALVDLVVLDDSNPRSLAFQLDQLRTHVAMLPTRDGSQALADAIEDAGAAMLEVSWLPSDADQVGASGRREVVDRFVVAARTPLRRFASQLNAVYFNDPARLRRMMGPR